MMVVQTSLDRIKNAIDRIRYFDSEVDDDCPLYIEGKDGVFYELLGNSPETGQEITTPLQLGDLANLVPAKTDDSWRAAWKKFDERQSNG